MPFGLWRDDSLGRAIGVGRIADSSGDAASAAADLVEDAQAPQQQQPVPLHRRRRRLKSTVISPADPSMMP
jgi:hypothetical protein